jgi:uncharacterized circularly permuted ATP-grasp superfamily protein/uncharacterized alpha-E superfamily protein
MPDSSTSMTEIAARQVGGSGATSAGVLTSYSPPGGFYDEMLVAPGKLRPHWRQFCDSMDALGPAEFARRWRQSLRLVHENGLAYSAHGDPSDQTRPWELDPLPVLITSEEWRRVSDALQQRARLFDHILADLYGPQQLLERGLLPPEVLYQHPGFRRPLHGIRLPNDRRLHLYAADLARAPSGEWWVLGDRSEAPSGAGFALENRILTSRMLPEAFQNCRVERLAPYFVALRETVAKLAPQVRDNPRVAQLSRGPKCTNYFEDAYLARYLSYTLVEGDDLTVRNNRVMIKTLDGLLPVDVLLRRPNSEDCDPLELSELSQSGTPGLVQAVRNNGVGIANALGSGLVESPIFMAFLPRLCKQLFGEELAMPGVATWWCGEPRSLTHVLDKLDKLMIRPAFRQRGHELTESKRLLSMTRDQLVAAIRAQPAAYVAQEQVSRSTMPVWLYKSSPRSTELEDESDGARYSVGSSHIALRAFAVASADSYYVMNGGLARVSKSVDPLFVSLLAGERSKDAWILADEPVVPVTLLGQQVGPLPIRRSGAELPSRVADHVFWLGRRLERAESTARLLRTIGLRVTAETYSSDLAEIPALLRVLVEQGQLEPGYIVAGIRDQLPGIEEGLPDSVFDESQPASLRSIVDRLQRSASVVRDRLSSDCWRIVTRLDEQFCVPQHAPLDLSGLLAMLDSLLIDLAAFSGMAMESMTRTYTWRFLDLGRRLERGYQTVVLLRNALSDSRSRTATMFEAILEVADSLMTYRSRYLANLQLGPVLDLLLTDETNPRSFAFQMANVVDHVNALPRDRQLATYTKEQELAVGALHAVRMLDVTSFDAASPAALQQVLEGLEERLPEISEAISHRYLSHARPAWRLGEFHSSE